MGTENNPENIWRSTETYTRIDRAYGEILGKIKATRAIKEEAEKHLNQ